MLTDEHLKPWVDSLSDELGEISLIDAHTHIGSNDPDGFRCSSDELLEALSWTNSRAVVIPMHEPKGYADANDAMIATAQASGGRLIPFCRLDPARDPLREATRSVEAGARGIKLHPRSERFELDDERLDSVFALAHERRLPVLVHAGRGIPALAEHALLRCRAFPGARIILAHAALADLSWIWRFAQSQPNLFFDTAWWSPTDLLTLFARVPPGQILYGSDIPYATSSQGFIATFRCAVQVGLSRDQLRSVGGAQLDALIAGHDPLSVGEPPGDGAVRFDLTLARIHSFLMLAIGQLGEGGVAARPLALARLACQVAEGSPDSQICRSIITLLDRHEALVAHDTGDVAESFAHLHLPAVASVLALTPDVGVPSEI